MLNVTVSLLRTEVTKQSQHFTHMSHLKRIHARLPTICSLSLPKCCVFNAIHCRLCFVHMCILFFTHLQTHFTNQMRLNASCACRTHLCTVQTVVPAGRGCAAPGRIPPGSKANELGALHQISAQTLLCVCVSLIRTADRHYACELCSR